MPNPFFSLMPPCSLIHTPCSCQTVLTAVPQTRPPYRCPPYRHSASDYSQFYLFPTTETLCTFFQSVSQTHSLSLFAPNVSLNRW